MFQFLARLGVHRIVIREMARSHNQASRYYSNALGIDLLLSLVAASCLSAASSGTGTTKVRAQPGPGGPPLSSTRPYIQRIDGER